MGLTVSAVLPSLDQHAFLETHHVSLEFRPQLASWKERNSAQILKHLFVHQSGLLCVEECFDESLDVEESQILGAFPEPNVFHRQAKFPANRDGHSSFGRTVEFRQHDAGAIGCF